MLCTPVFIFTSGSSALLGRPRCGLSIWLSLLAIFNTLFWVYVNFFHKKTDKTRNYLKSACWGLSICPSPLAIFNTLFRVYVNFFHNKTDKTHKYLKSAIFVWYENGHRWLSGAQSINAESLFNSVLTKGHLCPSCTMPFNYFKSSHCTLR